jgi:hypothetical protein
VTIYRVCGEISVTRSIGDPDYKTFVPGAKLDAFFLWPDGHDQVTLAIAEVSSPHITYRSLHNIAPHSSSHHLQIVTSHCTSLLLTSRYAILRYITLFISCYISSSCSSLPFLSTSMYTSLPFLAALLLFTSPLLSLLHFSPLPLFCRCLWGTS